MRLIALLRQTCWKWQGWRQTPSLALETTYAWSQYLDNMQYSCRQEQQDEMLLQIIASSQGTHAVRATVADLELVLAKLVRLIPDGFPYTVALWTASACLINGCGALPHAVTSDKMSNTSGTGLQAGSRASPQLTADGWNSCDTGNRNFTPNGVLR